MKSKSFNTTKRTAFEACKKALRDFDCRIVSSDFSSGHIQAEKVGGLLSYGHDLLLRLKSDVNGKIKVSVSSKSIGVQVIDWGSNSDNEEELIGIITKSIR